MTVIKGQKTYFIKPGSTQGSDTESLHLSSAPASDTESLNNENIERPVRTHPFKYLLTEEPTLYKKSFGRRKLRRYQNRCVLQTLQEEDDSASVIVFESNKSPLTRLLEDDIAIEFWNKFIEKSEEEQENILNSLSVKTELKSKISDNGNNNEIRGWISSKTKRTFKLKKNLSLEAIKNYEDDMLKFFLNSPFDVYVKVPLTSFDRLLLRAIARYHGLQTKTVNSTNAEEKPSVEIFNIKEDWVRANCFLTEFIQQLR
ncbi:R3H domain-containing protein 4-like [Sitophilus oryzae]|uniref:R3H domain-containing protein 4-like n=1 Tax=Sitophilus oryzae TaxID=7048 RepID=A0A6J2XYY5_SITOR|nr:R3H domain-containing protein 4-like [Sitophilus oryzae]